MKIISRRIAICRSLSVVVCAGLLSVATLTLHAAPFEETEPTGLVWFVGTVEQVVEGIPLIDLGEVHTLRQGSMVAAVRYRDSHFVPLGVLEVMHSDPTWCQTRKPVAFQAAIGDLVIFVEAPGDLGTGEHMQDDFTRHRVVANSDRNRYSTVRDSIEADTMQRLISKQPDWVKEDRRIAGVIRSPSVTREMGVRLTPFINQIMTFQGYEDRGVDVAGATSEAWKVVLDKLRRKNDSADSDATEPAVQIVQESTDADFAASQSSVSTVRRLVEESLFQRFPEERHVIAVICATLLRTKTTNERQWISQQFAVSQFPALGDQDQVVIDIEAIMRNIRKSQE